jgi:hypothetical protein
MTEANGKITVQMSVPALGVISGSKTLAEIVGGKAPEEADAPPVVVKPLKK